MGAWDIVPMYLRCPASCLIQRTPATYKQILEKKIYTVFAEQSDSVVCLRYGDSHVCRSARATCNLSKFLQFVNATFIFDAITIMSRSICRIQGNRKTVVVMGAKVREIQIAGIQ